MNGWSSICATVVFKIIHSVRGGNKGDNLIHLNALLLDHVIAWLARLIFLNHSRSFSATSEPVFTGSMKLDEALMKLSVRLSQFGHGIPESGGLSAFDISSKRDSLHWARFRVDYVINVIDFNDSDSPLEDQG